MRRKKPNKNKTEFEIVFEYLQQVECLEDVVSHYIEARTGHVNDIDRIPVVLLEALESIDVRIHQINGERMLRSIGFE